MLYATDSMVEENAAGKPRKTSAVVLFVKDEAQDIASWLAWYHIQGFDACIVFNDGSSDATVDIIRKASAVQDIRLRLAVGDPNVNYYYRQETSFQAALIDYASEFEWLAFFDVDEFILFREGLDAQSFLAGFPDADAIAVNWCNYGSSGHALKPEKPLFEAFTWHYAATQTINRHIKSFVRPDKVGPQWMNVHCFDVALDRYPDASGNLFEWGYTPGIINRDPDWSVAKLMHFQCRSMEHFVERLRKRPELPPTVKYWEACDINDEEDVRPHQFSGAVYDQISLYNLPVGADVTETTRDASAESPTVRADLVKRLWRGRDPFDAFPRHLYEPDMQSWGSHHHYLVEAVEAVRPSLIVEIGVWKGGSTIAMAERMRALGLPGTVIAVDTWLGAWDHWISDEWFEQLGWDHGYPTINRKFMNNVITHDLQQYVVPLPLDSLNAAQVLNHFSIRPDIVHIDGAHDYDSVLSDLRVWWPLLRPGGLLIGDDYYEHTHWPGVKQAFDAFFSPQRPSPLENVNGKCRVLKGLSD